MDFYSSEYGNPTLTWEMEHEKMFNIYDRLSSMYEMARLESDQIMRDIETKIYVEGGTFEDMEYLYTEAEDQMGEKKVGLLSKIIGWIRKFIKGLRDKIMSLFGKGEDTDVEVPKEQMGMIDKIIQHFNNIKAAFSKILSGDIIGGAGDLIGAAAFEFTVAAGAVAFITIRKSKLKDKFTAINKINDTIDSAVQKVDDFIKSKVGKTPFDVVGKALNFIKEKLLSPIGKAITAAGKWLSGEKDEEKSPKMTADDKKNLDKKLEEQKKRNASNANREIYKDAINNTGDDNGRKNGGKVVNASKAYDSVKDKLTDEQNAAYHALDGDPRAQTRYLNNLRSRNIIECVGFWFDDSDESFYEDADDFETSDGFGFWN